MRTMPKATGGRRTPGRMIRLLLALALALPGAAGLLAAATAAGGLGPDSSFPANPVGGTGRFAFDLEMRIEIESDKVSGPATVYVNSRDGSMALANPHTALWALGMPDVPGLQIHHVILRAGEAMVCGVHPQQGQGCMLLGKAPSPLTAASLSRQQAEAYFRSVSLTDQDNAPVDVAGTDGLEHVHGMGADLTAITFWFDPGRSTVATHMAFLGPGVGVMRDLRSNTNRIVRHSFYDMNLAERHPMSWMSIHLRDMRKIVHRIDTSRYPLVTAFTPGGSRGAAGLSDWMRTQGRQIAAWQRSLEACPDGPPGSGCREEYRGKIKRLQDIMKARVRAFGNAEGIPVPDD